MFRSESVPDCDRQHLLAIKKPKNFMLRKWFLRLCCSVNQRKPLLANLVICDIVFIMAVTKVSSTVHFVSRRSAVSGRGGAASGHWVPNTDVYATDTGLVVKVELPGMKSENLEITVEGNRLRITGNRPDCLPRAPLQFSGHGNQLRPV